MRLLLLLALGGITAAHALRDLDFGAGELRFIADFGFGAIALFGSVFTIVAMAQAFFSEIERGTAQTLLAKAVSRAEFILGKYAGTMVALTLFCVFATSLLLAILLLRERGLQLESRGQIEALARVDCREVLAIGFAHWAKFAVLSALTLLVGSLVRGHFQAVMLSLAVLVACHLQPLAQQTYLGSDSVVARGIAATIGVLFPNFEVFALHDQSGARLPIAIVGVAAYAALYTVAAVGLAALSFGRRDL